MATTPRLLLNLPTINDFTDVVPELVNQLRQIEATCDCQTGLSTARPASPFDGQLYYDKDLKSLKRYDAAAVQWIEYSQGTNPLGRLAFVSSTAASTAVSGTQEFGPYLTLTFNAKKNRKYGISWVLTLDNQTGNNTPSRFINVRNAIGNTVAQTDNILGRTIADVDDNSSGLSVRQLGGAEYIATADNVITLGLFLQATSGSNQTIINANSYHTFSVEDIGAY